MVVGSVSIGCEVVVIGAGPGGYVAAIRAAQKGKDVILVEARKRLGGVCLNEGCIPSKALIHGSDFVEEAGHASAFGITVGEVSVDMPKLVEWKDGIVKRLTGGVKYLCDKAGVQVIQGRAIFTSDRSIAVESEEKRTDINFSSAIIATGSTPLELPTLPNDGTTIIGATEALSLDHVPEKMAVIGGGYIGLELGTVFAKLGSSVSVIEFLPELLPSLDKEVARALSRRLKKLGVAVHLGTKATGYADGSVSCEGPDGAVNVPADIVLVSIGRKPSSKGLGLEEIGVKTDEKGWITVDDRQRTSVPGIYAIGDVIGGALLAHKAYREAKVAVGVICGEPEAFDNVTIPAVIYTDPEIAWAGMTEKEAVAAGFEVAIGNFPLAASGRAMTLGNTDGFIKAIVEKGSGRLLGVTMVGKGVSELIAEVALGLEMGAFAEDFSVTIHPHPTMSEAVQEAIDAAIGAAVHMAH